ncbi:MAG: ABC-2 type transport system permease protein [Ulvibacter sp.]|jgi:ABC-2 type transport system permease protein
MWFEILKFEIKYRARRLETYLFFVVLFCFSVVSFDFIFEDYNLGLVKENAPVVLARLMAVISGIFMIITSMVMGVPILRDFEHGMESLIFINPIKKRDYLLGRFLGSFLVLVFIFSGLIWGIALGTYMPWRDADNLLPFDSWSYLHPFIYIVIPTLFFSGSLFFVTGTLSRNLIVVYTQGVAFFVVFILSANIENQFVASLLEPFSFRTIGYITRAWSLSERNSLMVPMEGYLLYNRIFWITIGVLALVVGYFSFSFNVLRKSVVKNKIGSTELESETTTELPIPKAEINEGFLSSIIQLKAHALFYFNSIFKELSFWSILICGVAIIFINSVNLGNIFGAESLPKTYLIVEELLETSFFFFLIILVFYSGELIWKERGVKLNLIYDALPFSDLINLAGKFIGLLMIYVVLLITLIISGMLFQSSKGFYDFQLTVYFTGFFMEIFPFLIFYTFASFFIHVISNSKFIGYILVLVFFLMTMAMTVMGLGHRLLHFGGTSIGKYSDMNGYGHFLLPHISFLIYWLAFCIALFGLTVVFSIRGTETGMANRWRLSKQRWTKSLFRMVIASLVGFGLMGSFIFYNTNILNSNWSQSEKQAFRADYEKTLKTFEKDLQPKLEDVYLEVELYPADRNFTAEGYYILRNDQSEPIKSISVQKWGDKKIELDYLNFEAEATRDSTFAKFDYYTYILEKPLEEGDLIKMNFKQSFTTKGFVASNPSIRMVHNGTFLDNHQLPKIGYNDKFELDDVADRKKYGLGIQESMTKRGEAQNATLGNDGVNDYEINLEVIVGTDATQRALAPGDLLKEWKEGNRNYFHFKMSEPMMNLYSINSGRYEVLKDQWTSQRDEVQTPVELEILYHKGHETNLDRMMHAMKSSLDYYDKEFSPYQYKQLRIVEFPRYIEFAQSFPNMIPFSEALGFILDIDEEEDVDIVFFVTAHEVAHQWWGHQVTVSDTQGALMIIESLAQYSALMVLKNNFPPEKVSQFLQQERETYFRERVSDQYHEAPMDLVEGQEYIYYRKGIVNFYALQDYISEDSVNLALSRFIEDWNVVDGLLKEERYPTTLDLLAYFRAVTPDSVQYVITDLFEKVTLYDYKTEEGRAEELADGRFALKLDILADKFRVDSLGIESRIAINDWIDIGVYGLAENGEEELIYLEKHKISALRAEIEIVVDRKPTKSGIDPLNKLMDKKVEDNVVEVDWD